MSIRYPLVEWAKQSNIYEVNIRQYTSSGTFYELSHHLKRLKEMGVGILWLMPITPIAEKERLGTLGSYYSCKSYVEINPEFGTKKDFKLFVQDAHKLGLKIIIDWVANHAGHDHEWTKTHPEWFMQDKTGAFTERNGWKDVIDLNHNNIQMQQALINAMKYWVQEFDIDGFRCDMAHLVPLDFWDRARKECETIKPLFWFGECDHPEYSEVFDCTYAWKWMHASVDFINNKTSVDYFINVVKEYDALPKGALKTYFTSNHDENSWNGTEYEKYGKAAIAMNAYVLLLNGIPLIYSGQELPNYKRLRFFDKDEIEWNDHLPKLHNFYRSLLELRKVSPVFEDNATLELKKIADKGVYIIRKNNTDYLLAFFNFSETESIVINLQGEYIPGKYKSINSGLSYYFKENESFYLNAGEYLIYVKEKE